MTWGWLNPLPDRRPSSTSMFDWMALAGTLIVTRCYLVEGIPVLFLFFLLGFTNGTWTCPGMFWTAFCKVNLDELSLLVLSPSGQATLDDPSSSLLGPRWCDEAPGNDAPSYSTRFSCWAAVLIETRAAEGWNKNFDSGFISLPFWVLLRGVS